MTLIAGLLLLIRAAHVRTDLKGAKEIEVNGV